MVLYLLCQKAAPMIYSPARAFAVHGTASSTHATGVANMLGTKFFIVDLAGYGESVSVGQNNPGRNAHLHRKAIVTATLNAGKRGSKFRVVHAPNSRQFY